MKFPDGGTLHFEYTSDGAISCIRSSAEGTQSETEYTSNGYSLQKITHHTLVSEVPSAGSETEKTVSVCNITYGGNHAAIESDGKKEYVYYASADPLYAAYAITDGRADGLTLEKRVPNEYSFRITPKKTSEMQSATTSADSIVSQRLGSGISPAALPDMTDDYSTFAEADWEDTTLDGFNRPQKTTTNWKRIGTSSDNKAVYACTETVYAYAAEDPAYPCLQKTTTTYVNPNGAKSTSGAEKTVQVEKYSYCEHGNLVKTARYTEGEENTSGITVRERVCDDKGNIVREYSYNTLDSGTKFYAESEYAADGRESAVYDETGENKTVSEYANNIGLVRTRVLPNGGKLSYGYDASGRVTSVSQSTAEGESNQTTKKYEQNCITHLTSGKNVVEYEYDHKRRIKKVRVNGTETAYAYAGSAYDDTASVTYGGKSAEKVTMTRGTVVSERYTDKHGNVLAAKIGGVTQYANTYNADDTLQKSADEVTGSETVYAYTADGTKRPSQISTGLGTDVYSLAEIYTYNAYGQMSARTLTGTVSQAYGYHYKENAARDLEYITLPDGYRAYPLTDVNGRSTGRELTDADGNRKYGEYIYYRKVGDHATNMPASVYYGMTKSGKYVIGENVKYSYDGMGNISKVFENGTMTAKYTYDALNRLVREDNKKLGKTYFIGYDNCGNILSKRTAAYTLKAEEEIAESEEVLYGYAAKSDRLTMYNGTAIVYDDFGNPTSYKGNAATWQHGKLLTQYGSTAFVYDGYGRRIKKGSIIFAYDNEGNLIRQSDGTNTLEFIYDGSGLSGVKCNDVNYLYRKNAQGDITHILDNTGMVVAKYVYDAWGNHVIVDGNGNDLASGVGVLNPFRYRGYYYDTETNLYYLQTRYYDPEVGRFLSQDDVSYLAPDNINGLNLYAYCANNPVMNVDPTGQFVLASFLLGMGLAALTFGVVNVGSQLVGDLVNYVITGQWNSGWEDYLGAFIGGITGGIVFYLTKGNLAATFGVMGGIETLTTMLLTNSTGRSNYSVLGILGQTLFSTVAGVVSGAVFGGTKINGITIKRNSFLSVWKAGLTRLRNGTGRMSAKVILKGFVAVNTLRLTSGFISGALSGAMAWLLFLVFGDGKDIGYINE